MVSKSDHCLLVEQIEKQLDDYLGPCGFEYSFFLTGWYNLMVSPKLQLDMDLAPYSDCLAVCLISNPQMFEKTFVHWMNLWSFESGVESIQTELKRLKSEFANHDFTPNLTDYLDWTVFFTMNNFIKSMCANLQLKLDKFDFERLTSVKWIPDFALKPVTRLPYVHVQSAGYVSGLAYFYRPIDFGLSTNYVGCSLHPTYGGWFGFR